MRVQPAPAALAIFLSLAGHASAAELIQEMQGAWSMDGTECSDTFEKSGDSLRFKDRGDSINSGIIVSGDKITGSNGTCTAGRIQREKDRINVAMSCADTIMFSSVSVSFRITGPDSFVRYDPMFSDVLDSYHRCEP